MLGSPPKCPTAKIGELFSRFSVHVFYISLVRCRANSSRRKLEAFSLILTFNLGWRRTNLPVWSKFFEQVDEKMFWTTWRIFFRTTWRKKCRLTYRKKVSNTLTKKSFGKLDKKCSENLAKKYGLIWGEIDCSFLLNQPLIWLCLEFPFLILLTDLNFR